MCDIFDKYYVESLRLMSKVENVMKLIFTDCKPFSYRVYTAKIIVR